MSNRSITTEKPIADAVTNVSELSDRLAVRLVRVIGILEAHEWPDDSDDLARMREHLDACVTWAGKIGVLAEDMSLSCRRRGNL
jgi:hypothetical protein